MVPSGCTGTTKLRLQRQRKITMAYLTTFLQQSPDVIWHCRKGGSAAIWFFSGGGHVHLLQRKSRSILDCHILTAQE